MVKNTARKRGGQPGNINALKHGFYAHKFRENESGDLDQLTLDGLESEINMLRVMTRRIFEYADELTNMDKMTDSLGALGLAASRLAGLLRTKHFIGGDKSEEVAKAIRSAISQANTEMGMSI
jgi:hypothetical protein